MTSDNKDISRKKQEEIDAKGENYATESLLLSLMFEQYKIMKNIS